MTTRKHVTGRPDELRAEYDLSTLAGGVKGKYYERARAGTNLVLLKPEIARAFPDSKAVNDALGLLLRVARAGRTRAHAHEKSKASRVRRTAPRRRRTREDE